MTDNAHLLAVNATTRVTNVWPWYLTRASGIIAGLLVSLLLITGITSFTGHQYKIMAPLKSWANHRVLAIALIAAVLLHVGSLLFDKYITFSPAEVLLPFISPYKIIKVEGFSLGSLGVAFGITALYLAALIMLTSLTRIITSLPALWKATHYLSYIVVTLIFFHSIMIGTDLSKGFWRLSWVFINLVVFGFIILRLTRTGSLNE